MKNFPRNLELFKHIKYIIVCICLSSIKETRGRTNPLFIKYRNFARFPHILFIICKDKILKQIRCSNVNNI